MMLTRRRRDARIREQATAVARQLAVALSSGTAVGPTPYSVGLVLEPDEQVWAQVPARCSADAPAKPGDEKGPRRETDWLITNQRIAGRFYQETLRWYTWAGCVGCQVDLTPGREFVSLDFPGLPGPVHWRGPGVAPLAVAAVVQLHGAHAALEHPGLGGSAPGAPRGRTWPAETSCTAAWRVSSPRGRTRSVSDGPKLKVDVLQSRRRRRWLRRGKLHSGSGRGRGSRWRRLRTATLEQPRMAHRL